MAVKRNFVLIGRRKSAPAAQSSVAAHQRGGAASASITDIDATGSSVAPAKSGHAGQKIDRLA